MTTAYDLYEIINNKSWSFLIWTLSLYALFLAIIFISFYFKFYNTEIYFSEKETYIRNQVPLRELSITKNAPTNIFYFCDVGLKIKSGFFFFSILKDIEVNIKIDNLKDVKEYNPWKSFIPIKCEFENRQITISITLQRLKIYEGDAKLLIFFSKEIKRDTAFNDKKFVKEIKIKLSS